MNLFSIHAERKEGACATLNTSPSAVSVINQFAFYNFFSLVADTIHSTHAIWSVVFMLSDTPSVAFICSMISSRRLCACSFKSARYVHSSPLRHRSWKKGDTWLRKPSIANFSCRTLYGSYPMSVMFSYCLINSHLISTFLWNQPPRRCFQ